MHKVIALFLALTVVVVLVLGGCAGGAATADTAAFYKTNPITIVVNGGAGGATDFAGRVFSQFWSQITGGPTPQVVVKAGGGGLEGVNYTYNQAAPDGLTICVDHHPSDFTSPAITGGPGPKFDPRELSWIGIFGFSPNAFLQRIDSPYKTVDDLKKAKGLKIGYTTGGSIGHLAGALAIEAFKLDATMVGGYEAPEQGLAAKRGEIEGYSVVATVALDDVKKGFVKPLWVDTLEKSNWFPNTPPIASLVKLSPEFETDLRLLVALGGCKSFLAPPKIPAERLDYLRRAFDKMVALPAFIEAAKAKFPIWEKPLTGEQVVEDLNKVLNTPGDQKAALQSLMKKYMK